MPSFPQVEWIVQGIIPVQKIVLILGTPNSCKSWLVDSLAISILTGSKFLGEDGLEVRPASVILIDEDTPGDVLLQRLEKLSPNLDYIISNPRFHFHSVEGLVLKRAELEHLIAEIKSMPPPVVVFMDALTTVMSHLDVNNSADVSEYARTWMRIREAGASLVITHHFTEKAEVSFSDPNFSRRALGHSLLNSKTDVIFGCFRVPPNVPTRFVLKSLPRRILQGLLDVAPIEIVDKGEKTYPILLDEIPVEPSKNARRIYSLFQAGYKLTVKQVRSLSGNRLPETEIQRCLDELEEMDAIIEGESPKEKFKYRENPDMTSKVALLNEYQMSLLTWRHTNGAEKQLPEENKKLESFRQ